MVLAVSRTDVEAVLSPDDIVDGVEEAFAAQGGDVLLPNRIQMEKETPHGRVFVMPGVDNDEPQKLGLKVVTEFPENERRGVPSTLGVIDLYDPETGELDAVVDGTYITNYRTGAITAVAAAYLANTPRVVGVFGSSTQARYQVRVLDDVFDLEEVRIYSRSDRKHEAVAELEDEVAARLVAADTPAETTDGAQVVVSATTASQPVFPDDLVEPGTLYVSIGSNDSSMRELPGAAVSRADGVFVDDYERCLSVGDLAVPMEAGDLAEDDVATLSDLVTGRAADRDDDDQIFAVKSVGSVVLDLYVGALAVDRARETGAGTSFDLQGTGDETEGGAETGGE